MDQSANQPQTINCPNCGYAVEIGNPICGNCGQPLAGASGFPLPTRSSGTGKGLIVLFIVLIIGGALWAATAKITDVFERSDFGGLAGGGEPKVLDVEQVESPYKDVRAIVTALNKGGLHCNQIKIDHADEYVATGSCQAPGKIVRTHVQINLFFQRTSVEAVEDQMRKDRPFTYVHDKNWFVITQTATARKVHKILGGKLFVAAQP